MVYRARRHGVDYALKVMAKAVADAAAAVAAFRRHRATHADHQHHQLRSSALPALFDRMPTQRRSRRQRGRLDARLPAE